MTGQEIWSTSTSRNSATSLTAVAIAPKAEPRANFLHTALDDDHLRLAYTEILADETKETAAAFWRRAYAWFTAHGIAVVRVLSDNGSCYISRLWHDTCHQLGVTVKNRLLT